MNKLILKLKAVWFLLKSNGCILTYVDNPEEEEIDAGFIFAGLDREQIILFSDSLADEMEADLQDEEDQMMAERLGGGMVNYINQIHLN